MGLPVIGEFVKGIISPVKDIIDEFHHSGEEKQSAQMAIFRLEQAMREKLLEYHAKITELQASIVLAETKGKAWMQQNWRPILMLSFTAIIVNNYILVPWINVLAAAFGSEFQAPVLEFPSQFWTLLIAGVSGYLVARTAEKTKKNWSVNIGKGKMQRVDEEE
jgi:hypothetical protein